MKLNIGRIKHKNYELFAEQNTVYISGSIDFQNSDQFFIKFLKRLNNNILESNLKEIKIDVKRLEFLNSNAIRNIVEWISITDELAREQKYAIQFITNPKLSWQKISLKNIVNLNPERLTVI